jgi:CMP-N-acetylneuraminic acid synthetase/spore coat polysaccharide biosynthesis predicted glycosyltransferase SpsG
VTLPSKKVIAIIPARGGSKGIPRKNLRPVNGKPLIFYAIRACLDAGIIDQVVVSTDDEEIALFAERFGASVHYRDPRLADDKSTLDPVILHSVEAWEYEQQEVYDIVLTVQPTSPLIRGMDIRAAIERFLEEGHADSLISVVDDRHLNWTIDTQGHAFPLYKERVNRQYLPLAYKETGAILLCTRQQLQKGTRIGQKVVLFEMEKERSFDIDSVADLLLCESILNQKKIVFVVAGHPSIGLGHAFRAVMLAGELVRHHVSFICEKSSKLAADYITEHNYPVVLVEEGGVLAELQKIQPDLIINDILDTELSFIQAQKSLGAFVVNFEDLGSGIQKADLVFNALYTVKLPLENVFYGEQYFCLRDEFLYIAREPFTEKAKRALISFGGVDPANLTMRVLKIIYPKSEGVQIQIVVGPGYAHLKELQAWILENAPEIEVIYQTKRISDLMNKADLVFTSGGRTVYELASLCKPMCVVCQNTRELTHTFASPENGIVNLGLHSDVLDQEILEIYQRLTSDSGLRKELYARMQTHRLSDGKKRVVSMIENLIKR